jgi:hypothetical protein
MTLWRVENTWDTLRCLSEALNSCTYSKQDAFCVTLKGFGLEHTLFSRFVRMIDVNFICPTCYRDIPQSVNPDCSISIIHEGRLGKAFIMFSDTVNILWIFASVECVNETSPAAGDRGTSGPLLCAHTTCSRSNLFWILKQSNWRAEQSSIFETFTQSDMELFDCIYKFIFLYLI